MTESALRLAIALHYTYEVTHATEKTINEELDAANTQYSADLERPARVLLPFGVTQVRQQSRLRAFTNATETLHIQMRSEPKSLISWKLILPSAIMVLLTLSANSASTMAVGLETYQTMSVFKWFLACIDLRLFALVYSAQSTRFYLAMTTSLVMHLTVALVDYTAQADDSTFFGATQLTIYLVLITLATVTLKTYFISEAKEEAQFSSQAVINKVASVIFTEQKECPGHGILHFSENQLRMVRYSDRFVSLLRMNGELDVNQSNVAEKEQVTDCLEDYLLCEKSSEDSHSFFLGSRYFSFGAVFQRAVNAAQKNKSHNSPSDKVTELFADNFTCTSRPYRGSSPDLLAKQSQTSPQGQKSCPATLEISTHVLDEANGLYLVTLKNPPLSRLLIPIEAPQVFRKQDELADSAKFEAPLLQQKPQSSLSSPQIQKLSAVNQQNELEIGLIRVRLRRFFSSDSVNPMRGQQSALQNSASSVLLTALNQNLQYRRASALGSIPFWQRQRVPSYAVAKHSQMRGTLTAIVSEELEELEEDERVKVEEEVKLPINEISPPAQPSQLLQVKPKKSSNRITRSRSQFLFQKNFSSQKICRSTLISQSFADPRKFIKMQEMSSPESREEKLEIFDQKVASLFSKTDVTRSSQRALVEKQAQNSSSQTDTIHSDSLKVYESELSSTSKIRKSQYSSQSPTNLRVGILSPSNKRHLSQDVSLIRSRSDAKLNSEMMKSFKKLFSNRKNKSKVDFNMLQVPCSGHYVSSKTEDVDHVSTLNSVSSIGSIKKSQKPAQKHQAQQNQSKLFFFKCIHDLKHPTQAIKDEIEQIIESAGSFAVKKENAHKTFKYEANKKEENAAKFLRKFASQNTKSTAKNNNRKKKKKKQWQRIACTQDFELPGNFNSESNELYGKDLDSEQDKGQDRIIDIKALQEAFWNLPLENFINGPQNFRRRERRPQEERKQPAEASKRKVISRQDAFMFRSENISLSSFGASNKLSKSNHTNQLSGESSFSNTSERIGSELKSLNSHDFQQVDLSRANKEQIGKFKKSKTLRRQIGKRISSHSIERSRSIFQADISQKFENNDNESQQISRKRSDPYFQDLAAVAFSQGQRSRSVSRNSSISRQDLPRRPLTNYSSQQSIYSNPNSQLSDISHKVVRDNPVINFARKDLRVQKLVPTQNFKTMSFCDKSSNWSQSRASNVMIGQEKGQFQQQRMAIQVNLLLQERRYLIYLVESHMRKRMKIKQHSHILQSHVEMQQLLLHDLMNLATMNSNTFSFVNEYFDFKQLVKKSFKVFKVAVKLKGIELNGPIFEKPLDRIFFKEFFGDQNRYRQIIVNFVSNAIKFTPKNGTVAVLLRSLEVKDINTKDSSSPNMNSQSKDSETNSFDSAPDKEIRDSLQVQQQQSLYSNQLITYEMIFRDSGCGISEENKKKLFSNYQKLEETQEKNKQGVGLGLSICRDIIRASGGSIDIMSTLGKGTDFIIKLQAKCRVNKNELEEAQQRIQDSMSLSRSVKMNTSSEIFESDDSDSMSQSDYQNFDEVDQQSLSSVSEDENEMQSYSESSKSVAMQQQHEGSSIVVQDRLGLPSCIPLFKQKLKVRKLSIISENVDSREHQSASEQHSSVNDEEEKEVNDSSVQNDQTAILVANDCPFILDAVKRILSRHFDLVHTAENGVEAVEHVTSRPVTFYTAIVLDIDMPQMDGIEACEKMVAYFQENEQQQQLYERGAGLCSGNLAGQEDDFVRRKVPSLYALTQESNLDTLDKIHQAGFKSMMDSMTKEKVMMILENAGLQFRDRKNHRAKKRGSAVMESEQDDDNDDDFDDSDDDEEGEEESDCSSESMDAGYR